MADLLTAWLLFPLVLVVLAIGAGLLIDRTCGRRTPAALLPALGIAVIIIVGQFASLSVTTAPLVTPACVLLAAAGFVISPRWQDWLRPGASLALPAVGAAVFAVFAAPIVLSGEATFAGYIKLDDTATWLAFTDQLMERGRDLEGLAQSTYARTLEVNLEGGYPLGGFAPLGVSAKISGVDFAWAFQPFLAVLAAAMALALYELARPLIASAWTRGAVVFFASQPALLFAYLMWGAIKEAEVAMLLPAMAALAICAVGPGRSAERSLKASALAGVPLGIVAAALVAVLSIPGGVWLIALLLPGSIFLVLTGGPGRAGAVLGGALAAALACSVPLLGDSFSPSQEALRVDTELGNLIEPLGAAQFLGIWPTGDFRLDPVNTDIGFLLAGLAGFATLGGLVLALYRRAGGLVIYAVGGLLGVLAISLFASPWIDAKAMATASPAVLLLAGVTVATLHSSRRRTEAVVLGIALIGGVVWSNLLAYRDVNLAPREQLAELERIGDEIDGQGPTLMTEYQPYGARYFLRDADPEGASELRYREIPQRDGTLLDKAEYADTDEFDLAGLLAYRTLVLRRSPAQSRPPSIYRLTSSGDFYSVWQRPPESVGQILEHLPLGGPVDPAAVPQCAEVRSLAALAGSGGTLAAMPRAPVSIVIADRLRATESWFDKTAPGYLTLDAGGVAAGTVTVSGPPGERRAWLFGSTRADTELWVDGEIVGSVGGQLNNSGQYVELGAADLAPGNHAFEVRYDGPGLGPGTAGPSGSVGPFVFAPDDVGGEIRYFGTGDATELCGQRWDWIEAIAPTS